jgi:hypothetical protein
MGFFLALFYLLVAYLGTKTVFGPLEKYHVELILAGLVFCVSLPALQKTFVQKTAQSLALAGLALAVFMSLLVGRRWITGAVKEFQYFIPNAFAYFIVVLHCQTKLRLKILVLLLLFICVFVTLQGMFQLKGLGGLLPQRADEDSEFEDAAPTVNLAGIDPDGYLLPQFNPDGSAIYRLKGQNFLNDPNDFAQLLVCTLPLTFIFWRPKSLPLNVPLVFPMVLIVLYGVYLTHSRGALLAVAAIAIVASRRKIGTIPSLVLSAGLLLGARAVNVTGGREISAQAGEDRTALWGDGLQLLKENPLFGAGYNQMADIVGKTAHNSIIVCAAELGLFGLFFWSMFLFPTLRDALVVASPNGLTDPEPSPVDEGPYAYLEPKMENLNKEEISQMARLIVISLTGFLVSGMFLSRAFVMTFFLLGGMAEVVFQMALDRGMVAPRLPLARVAAYSGVLGIFLVPTMWVLVRVLNALH